MTQVFDEIYRLAKLGEYDQALKLLLGLDDGDINPPYDNDLNHAWYAAGDLYYKKRDFRAAAQAFDKAVAVRPDDAEALMALANCYFELDMPSTAERYLRIALKHADNAKLLYNLGNALFDQERFDEALAEYEKIPPSACAVYEPAQRNMAVARERLKALH